MIILINPENWHSAAAECLAGFVGLNSFEKILSIFRLVRELVLLPAGCLGFLPAAKFLGGVFQTQVNVSVERDADFAVPHQVLERFRVHPGLGLIAAVGMAADVRGDVGHLDPVDIVVALDHTLVFNRSVKNAMQNKE